MDFDPPFQVPDVCAKFRRNWFKIATVRAHTDTHRDHTRDLIICPMLCYSNGTEYKYPNKMADDVAVVTILILQPTSVISGHNLHIYYVTVNATSSKMAKVTNL